MQIKKTSLAVDSGVIITLNEGEQLHYLIGPVTFHLSDDMMKMGHPVRAAYEGLIQQGLVVVEEADQTVDALKAYVTRQRYYREIGGTSITLNGETIPVSTARGDERATLNATYSMIRDGLRQDGAAFKFNDGVSRRVPNAVMQAVILVVSGHVQACFDIEADLLDGIAAGTITTTDQIDAAYGAIPALHDLDNA